MARVGLIVMDEYAEDLPGPALPNWAEAYFESERAWHRLLRGTGLVMPEESVESLAMWTAR